MQNKKSYYAVIPANVRYDNRLKLLSRMLYGEITALCNEKGYCWATNRYFAELYDVSNTTISSCISQLKEFGYIHVEIIYKEGSKEILNRYLKIVNAPIQENLSTPIQKNLTDNNTLINNTDNNTINISPDGQDVKKQNAIDKPNNQLFTTTSKLKKKGENQFITVIEELSSNQLVRDALQKYCGFRRKRGLTIDQWKLMVEKFKQDSDGKTVQQVIDCIEQCIINGRNSLYYTNSYVQQPDFGNYDKPTYKKDVDGFDMPNSPMFDD